MIMLAAALLTFGALASEVPNNPPEACYDGCTSVQEKLLSDFETKGVLPERTPAVYSGVCNHLGMYGPEVDHYTVVLLDEVKNKWNFAAIFAYFAPENEFKDWTLATARREMSPYWSENGDIKVGDNTARVVVNYENGTPAYIYWMRQDPETNDLLLISYAGFVTKSFCRLQKH